CVDCSRHGPLWLQGRRDEDSHRAVRREFVSRTPPAARIVLRISEATWGEPNSLSERMCSASLGLRRWVFIAAILSWPAYRRPPPALEFCPSGSPSVSRTSRNTQHASWRRLC